MYQSMKWYRSGVRHSGAGFVVPPPISLGRAIIFDGTDDYGENTDTGTAVPSSQAGWRFMARFRNLGAGDGAGFYIIRDTSSAILTLQHYSTGTFGRLHAYVGPAADSTGFVTVPAADCIVLVRANPAGTEVSLEIWDTAGANRQAGQNISASGSNTNFQNRIIQVGAINGSSGFWPGKIDRMFFKTGAGTYNAAAPNPLTDSADIFDWTFDSNNGADALGRAPLTLSGSPTFEDTP